MDLGRSGNYRRTKLTSTSSRVQGGKNVHQPGVDGNALLRYSTGNLLTRKLLGVKPLTIPLGDFPVAEETVVLITNWIPRIASGHFVGSKSPCK